MSVATYTLVKLKLSKTNIHTYGRKHDTDNVLILRYSKSQSMPQSYLFSEYTIWVNYSMSKFSLSLMYRSKHGNFMVPSLQCWHFWKSFLNCFLLLQHKLARTPKPLCYLIWLESFWVVCATDKVTIYLRIVNTNIFKKSLKCCYFSFDHASSLLLLELLRQITHIFTLIPRKNSATVVKLIYTQQLWDVIIVCSFFCTPKDQQFSTYHLVNFLM